MDKKHAIQYINGGQFGQDVLKYVTKSTEKYVEKLVKERGISLTSSSLQRIYNFTEIYAKQLADTIASEALNDQDHFVNKEFVNTNIYRP